MQRRRRITLFRAHPRANRGIDARLPERNGSGTGEDTARGARCKHVRSIGSKGCLVSWTLLLVYAGFSLRTAFVERAALTKSDSRSVSAANTSPPSLVSR